MREFINLIEQALDEKFERGNVVAAFPVRKGTCEVYKNPSSRDLKEIMNAAGHEEPPRCFLVGRDALIWSTFSALHQEVRNHLNLPNDAIPLILYGEPRRGVDAMVTDCSRNTPIWHSPDVHFEIMCHPYLEAMFGEDQIRVSYYDEGVEGPWDELGNEDDDQDN